MSGPPPEGGGGNAKELASAHDLTPPPCCQECEGEVFAYDGATQTVVIREAASAGAAQGDGPHPPCNLRVLNTKLVKEIVSAQPRPRGALPAHLLAQLPALDLPRALARETAATQEARQQAMRVGVGVTKAAQEIFDSLSKTMPCVWEDKDIIILGEVVVAAPDYSVESCKCRTGDQAALERVRKVLTLELSRIASGEEKAQVR